MTRLSLPLFTESAQNDVHMLAPFNTLVNTRRISAAEILETKYACTIYSKDVYQTDCSEKWAAREASYF